MNRALKRLRRWLPGGRERLRREIQDELAGHLERLTEDQVARGLSPEAARRAARLRFGNTTVLAERCRDERPVFRADDVLADLRFGVRLLRRSPGFALVTTLSLGLGIGANTAIFSLVHGVLLQDLPFPEPDRLLTSRGFSVPDYEDLRQHAGSFDRVAIWASNLYTVVMDGEAEQIPAIVASPDLLSMLGEPVRGRVFRPEEDRQPLVVLSYEMWQSRFGGRDEVVGRALDLGGRPHTVVGVMAPAVHFPSAQYRFWVTCGSALDAVPGQREDRSLRIFRILAHLRPGATASQARAEMRAFSDRQARDHPDANRDLQFELQPLLESMVGGARTTLLILLGTVGLVLLIACANVANLLLARTASRRGELTLRTALGATRGRVVRQLLCESLLLSGLGGGLGLLAAEGGLRWLRSLPSATLPRLDSVELDSTVLGFTLAVSVLTGLAFGVLPALHATGRGGTESLRETGRTASPLSGRRLRPTLVALEIALTVVVTVSAGLLLRSFASLTRVDPGFSSDHLLTGMVTLVDVEVEERPRVVAGMLEEIARLPGVESAGAGTGLPPETAQRVTRYELPGADPGENPQLAYFLAVTPDYLPALRGRLLSGRGFSLEDTAVSPKVVLVSERLARARFAGRSPIGERLRVVNGDQSAEWRTIVGMVADVRYGGLDDGDAPAIYTPYAQNPQLLAGVYLMVRSRADGPAAMAAVRRAVREAAPGLYAVGLRPMSDVVRMSVLSPRLNALVLSLFSLLALVLSATGIYGLVSYSISQRTHEIGVRIAMGARRSDVVRLAMGHVIVVVGAGLAGGLLGSVATSRVLRTLLFEIRPTDPLTLLLVAAGLFCVGMIASYMPVRRATLIDPVRVLRCE